MLILIGMCFAEGAGVTFFPFGNNSSDQRLEKQDDAFTTISLNFDLQFFGKLFKELHVSTNGIIYFGQGSTSFIPVPFPLNGTQCVAAYWVDSDPREGGDIFHREVFDPDVLSSITDEVRKKFVNQAKFRSSWAFIVTFNNVPRFGCQRNVLYACHMVVNHQTILTSNGIDSFVIFLYDKLGYANAQIGFNAGDGKRYFLVPNSNIPSISNYALTESNVGEQGKWMFSISGEISSACGTNGLLDVYPKKVLFFGGQEVSITGPCFKRGHNSIDVMFGETKVNCPIINSLKIICITPYVDILGRIDLFLKHDNVPYISFISSHDVSDDLVKSKKLEIIEQDADTPFNVTWNVSSNPNNQILISGMQEDIVIDRAGKIITLERKQIYIKPPSTGIYEYRPDRFIERTDEQKSNQKTIRKISLSVDRSVFQKIIFEDNVDFSCDEWYDLQPNESEIERLKKVASRINPCQPSIPSNIPARLPGNFEMADTCHPSGKEWCNAFHPGAKVCYRSTVNPNDTTTQCCYDTEFQLILKSYGCGSLSMCDPSKSKLRHFTDEILPSIRCGEKPQTRAKYQEKRPPIDSEHFVPPRVGRATGDPHFMTLDDVEYDFNPVGEFIYLQGPGLMVQTRIAQFVGQDGSPKSASYFSAFAIKPSDSEVIQIEMTALKSLQVRLGNISLQHQSLGLGALFIDYINQSYVSVETGQGLKLQIQVLNGMLHTIITLDQLLKGKVFGLIGNWDDDPENDFMLPNKTFIPKNSSNVDIHYKFGMEWTTNENTSIFSYPVGLSWKDFQNKNFIPIFDDPPPDARCKGNKNCLFDLHVTGDINVGLANNEVEMIVNQVETMYQKIGETCVTNIDIPGGDIEVEYGGDRSFVKYTIICKPGREKRSVTCEKGRYSKPLDCNKLPSAVERNAVHFFTPMLLAIASLLHALQI